MDSVLDALAQNYESNPMFHKFSREEFNQFMEIATTERYPQDTVMFTVDDEPRGLYFLLEGKVQITKIKQGRPPRVIAEIEAPTVLGELAMLVHRVRTSTATTLSPTTVLLFNQRDYNRLIEENSLMAFKLSRNMGIMLAHKIELMNQAMMEMKREVKEFSTFKQTLFNDWNF